VALRPLPPFTLSLLHSFHSCLLVLHAHWQRGLLARPFNSTAFSISLLIVNYFLLITPLFPCVSSCSMPLGPDFQSFQWISLYSPCTSVRFGPPPHPRPAMLPVFLQRRSSTSRVSSGLLQPTSSPLLSSAGSVAAFWHFVSALATCDVPPTFALFPRQSLNAQGVSSSRRAHVGARVQKNTCGILDTRLVIYTPINPS
jgi:hypothetical protein